MLKGQMPVIMVGLIAMAILIAIHLTSKPQGSTSGRLLEPATCPGCGTVVAVRRSAHSVPVYFVEIRMDDGSLKTVRHREEAFRIGDLVEVNGDALARRAAP
jgi:hypothetical protein